MADELDPTVLPVMHMKARPVRRSLVVRMLGGLFLGFAAPGIPRGGFIMLTPLFLAIGLTWLFARRPAVVERMQFAIPLSGEVSHFALSPDGTSLVFVSPDEETGIPMLFVQRIGSANGNVLAGTQGASYPFWSPDSGTLAFFANGKLLKVAVTGGAPQALATVESARGGSWGSRGVIIYAPDSGSPIWRVNADGTGLAPVTNHLYQGSEQSHRWPVFLPDGNHFLFWETSGMTERVVFLSPRSTETTRNL